MMYPARSARRSPIGVIAVGGIAVHLSQVSWGGESASRSVTLIHFVQYPPSLMKFAKPLRDLILLGHAPPRR